jgi:cytochrome c biogenesis protein CcmG, thiol:disulfide interchange protein DsbE
MQIYPDPVPSTARLYAGSFGFYPFNREKEMLMFKKIIVLMVLALALQAGCTKSSQKDTAAADFTLQDMSGKKVTLSEYKGKVVLLEFWATWCPPCRASAPDLEKLHKNYKDKGLVVLAVSMDEGGWDEVRSFITEYGITYSVLMGTEDVAVQYQVRSIPLLLIVNKEGKISKRYLGFGAEVELEKDIKAYL